MALPAGSPSRGGDVKVYVKDLNQPSLPTPFYFFLVSISVFMAFSTVFHSTNSLDDCFITLFFWYYLCLFGPFDYLSLYESVLQP